ncbi:GbsR/MarR family transcriptional regulator [Brevibacillus composti]|uniref:HTH-type transcriptional regulator n=1 Tax=Brevibacillus composti TaxID=2796470 RepID=A0A7T5JNM5_9BACL|nr:GbsR/MarR family transcriptional regulator [Brevibacillus composti]QQE74339.1 GbsR/MarR family transcriptional regulator [Brevibacillus composti]QUO41421.1 GbsR/MarR family transcriptional regulator [Brevibacillus composti]
MEDKHEEKLYKAQDRVIETLAKNMDLYGITMSTGLLYGTMLFQNKAMTLDEMGEALEMSKTSMSTGVRTLMDLQMVDKIWKKGTRKDHYEVNLDWHQTFIDFFSLKWRAASEQNVHAMKKSRQELLSLLQSGDLSDDLRSRIELSIDRIDNALAYYNWLSRFIDALESHEIFELVPKDPVQE